MDNPNSTSLFQRLASIDAKWWISGFVLPVVGLLIAVLAVDDWRGPVLSAFGFEVETTKDEAPLDKVNERDLKTYRELEEIKVDRRFREK